jgi:hypothetical protein
MEGAHGGVLDGAVHPFGLAVGPGVMGLGELVRDAVIPTDAVELSLSPGPGKRPGWMEKLA